MPRANSRSPLPLALLVLVVGALAVGARPAPAEVSFHLGGGFEVGGVRFHVGVHDHDPVRYYRVARPLHVAGVHCSDRCYVRSGYHYHHASCPLVRTYFGRHGYRPVAVYDSYVPRPIVVQPPIRPVVQVHPRYAPPRVFAERPSFRRHLHDGHRHLDRDRQHRWRHDRRDRYDRDDRDHRHDGRHPRNHRHR